MTLEIIRSVFAWCTVMNLVLLLFWFAYFRMAHDWLYRIHGKWFDIPADKFDVIHYGAMAGFKLGIILFNLVPYLALHIVG